MPFLAPTEAEALGCCPRTLLSDDHSRRNTQTAAALRFSLRQMKPTGIRRNEIQLPRRRLSTLRLPWWGKSEAFPAASAVPSLVDRVSKRRGERCHERIRCFDHVLGFRELRRTDISDELLERGDALVLHLLLHLVEIAVLL